jgi:hypothetical protein
VIRVHPNRATPEEEKKRDLDPIDLLLKIKKKKKKKKRTCAIGTHRIKEVQITI